MIKLIIPFFIILFSSCTKELNISDFSADFESYKPELRIEAILNTSEFSESIIRVDRTILVTDTSLFNGKDDNGDWESYTDENDNGQWDEGEPLNDDIGVAVPGPMNTFIGRGNGIPDLGEPRVDDYSEILPQIHDSTLSIILMDGESNIVAEFEWLTVAGEFDESFGGRKGPMSDVSYLYHYTFGGYKPKNQYKDLNVDIGSKYQFKLTTEDGSTIHGSTTPVQKANQFNAQFSEMINDTLLINQYSIDGISWHTTSESYISSARVEKIISPDSLVYEFSGFLSSEEIATNGESIYNMNLFFLSQGLYQLTVIVFDDYYGNYLISELPLRDESLSNLRDENDHVVLGIAGSITESKLIFQIRY
ncbi:MAG: hypothetical protein ISR83_05750 [Candidatus Marinimicrobia bacterium]|nr:hypothetical protein [Candidatus Neomarinimicrobiota bacterium]